MEGIPEEVEDVKSISSDSIGDSDGSEASTSGKDDEIHLEEPLSEKEIEELIDEFLEVESKAAEAQEALEKESLAKVEAEVREELAKTLNGNELDAAVADEMNTFREEWEAVLDELETESANLLEQLDGAGIELPSLYKLIESQVPNGCCTEAWRKRAHWVGTQVTGELTESISSAEQYLQTHRPVRRRHGKLLEEGASGFLQKKVASDGSKENMSENSEVDWSTFIKKISDGPSEQDASFGSKHWAAVYLASTPQQAASMGLKFPGVDEVEEIDDIDDSACDPFVAAAIENEKELVLSEEQKKKFKKVKEEEDADIDRKLQLRLKRRRYHKRQKKINQTEASSVGKLGSICDEPSSLDDFLDGDVDNRKDGQCVPNDEKETAFNCLKTNVNGSCEESSMNNEKPPRNNESVPLFESDVLERNETTTDHHAGTVGSDDETHSRMALDDPSTPQKMMGDPSCANSDPLHSVNEKYHCTACTKMSFEVHSHPILRVIICGSCKYLIEEKLRVKDPDCSECYCGWCGQSCDLVNCKSCKTLFCITCIKRNIGEQCMPEINASSWKCFCCSPDLLQKLTSELEKALEIGDLVESTSESDSDDSDVDVSLPISNKRKRKKRIRRILDDAELGEETKKKIAIEKERQERLKSLKVQFSAESKITTSASLSGTLIEDASVEVLGDASTGYIVNVVREKGEEAVEIPPSISAKLKAHQVTGIRFLWENIIQSIRKVKAGDKGLGCILAHTMGLGKTFQVIAFLYTAMRSIDLGLRTALIVTPVNVLHNWRQEFTKWRPSELKPLRVFMLEDVPRERRAELFAKWRRKGGVFLIGYTAFRNLSFGKHVKDRHIAREICSALQDGPDILVCDEAHMIKNTRADTTQALKLVKCQRRIALTGSPLQNNLMEYYCMVDFVREGFLGSSHEFRNRFQNPIENGQHTNSTSEDVKIMNQRSHILYEQLKGFVQRMDMNVVKKDLPPKTVFVIAVKLSSLQRRLYKRFLEVHGFTNDRACDGMRKSFFAGYQALAQIWNHPGILQLRKERDYASREDTVDNFLADDSSSDENIDYNMVIGGEKSRNASNLSQGKTVDGFFQKDWWNDLLRANDYKELEHSGKMVLLLDILSISSGVEDKALVFSQSIPTLDLIEFYLSKLPRTGKRGKFWKKDKDWYRLDGRTESSERQRLVEKFNDPTNRRVKCALISTRAGALGINLHAANRVIIVDGSWNPTYDLQAIYRAWRYGQKKPVFAYRLMAHGTMEEKIYKRQVTKEGLAARVVDRQQVHRTISREEMLHLFEFGDDENPDTSECGLENGCATGKNVDFNTGNSSKQRVSLSHGSCSDKLMESLLSKHNPRWIANYHEHETLLQENEDEKLSKEEQDMAWEVYRRSLEWEEVQRVNIDESASDRKNDISNSNPTNPSRPNNVQHNQPISDVGCSVPDTKETAQSKDFLRKHPPIRKCTNLAHMLTLRCQGTKFGCSTICGECAQEISWESLKGGAGRATK